LELMGRDGGDSDERERTARALQHRFGVDVAQADRVATLAEHLNAQLPAAAPPRFAPLLRYAAWLHETGWAIARNDMQKHGAYILAHAEMPGYSRLMQDILAILVKAQKRKLPDKDIAALPEAHRAWVWQNALALRLAVLLHRARTPIAAIDYPDIRRFGDHYRLRFPDGYLAARPLTLADLQQEQTLWQESSPWTLEYHAPE
ncbi:MAG: Ppx/GppA family phosphatase, partial [Cardiobacterium sp.]